jgi:hypothetical protein
MNLETILDVRLALKLIGGALFLAAAFASWIYLQFIRPTVEGPSKRTDDIEGRLRVFELAAATAEGKDLPDRVSNLEERSRQLELDVNTLKSSESQRNQQLSQGLLQLGTLIEQLKEDMLRGDIDSRVDSAEALVASLRIAVTLAKLQSQEARDHANEQLSEALAALDNLKAEQRRRTRLPAA